MSSDVCVVMTRKEMTALYQAGPECMALYLVLRSMMDLDSGLVGYRSAISRYGLCRELETATQRGRGLQVTRPGDDKLDGWIEKLMRRGLVKRVGNGQVLVFLLPMAFRASERDFHTGDNGATALSTEQATVNPSIGAGFDGFEATAKTGQKSSLRRYIRVSGCTPSQSSSTAVNEVASDDAARGVTQDRPSGSQASSACCRSGNTYADPYRDRPTASHVSPQGADSDEETNRDRAAPSRDEGVRADTSGCLIDAQQPISARSLAMNESFAIDRASTDTAVGHLRAVLNARGVRTASVEPVLSEWAEQGVTPDEVHKAVEKAIGERLKAGSLQPIGIAYVASILQSQRVAVRRAITRLDGAAPRPSRGGVGDLEALAKRLNIAGARPGEQWHEFRERVEKAYRTSDLALSGVTHGAC